MNCHPERGRTPESRDPAGIGGGTAATRRSPEDNCARIESSSILCGFLGPPLSKLRRKHIHFLDGWRLGKQIGILLQCGSNFS